LIYVSFDEQTSRSQPQMAHITIGGRKRRMHRVQRANDSVSPPRHFRDSGGDDGRGDSISFFAG